MGELETIELLEEVMNALQKPQPKTAFGKPGSLADLEGLFSSESEAECGSEDTEAVLELLEQTMQPQAAEKALIEAANSPETDSEVLSVPHPSEVCETYLSTLSPTDFTAPIVLSEAELPISETQLEAITARREYYRTAEQDNRP